MQQAQGNFTPEQLIVAARRAEAQGQPAYALQFYRYIADNFGSSTEAYEARDAIYRLSPPEQSPVQPANGYAQPISPLATGPADYRQAPTLDAGPGPSHGRPVGGRKAAAKRKVALDAESDADADTAQTYAAGPAYRIGRLVAAMLSTMGWLLFIAGLAMGPLIMVALTVKSIPKGLREGIAGNLLMVGGATVGMLFLGLFAIFAAQAARAIFDTADAVRHLLYSSGRDNGSSS
jgi:hypothetical protein